MTRDELIERLAAIEHARWADWQAWVHKAGYREHRADPNHPKHLLIPGERVEAWERQIVTPYADLSEREQASDREQVMRYWPVIVDFVADWLDGNDLTAHMHDWREEMGAGVREVG